VYKNIILLFPRYLFQDGDDSSVRMIYKNSRVIKADFKQYCKRIERIHPSALSSSTFRTELKIPNSNSVEERRRRSIGTTNTFIMISESEGNYFSDGSDTQMYSSYSFPRLLFSPVSTSKNAYNSSYVTPLFYDFMCFSKLLRRYYIRL
jgi:hypothetical protein